MSCLARSMRSTSLHRWFDSIAALAAETLHCHDFLSTSPSGLGAPLAWSAGIAVYGDG